MVLHLLCLMDLKMPLKKNINISSKISHIAHKYNISVEGEIGEVGYFKGQKF